MEVTEIYSFVTTLTTIILGGGWFIHYRAGKRKAYGEATQAEADGWAKQQEVYQKTIADLEKSCDYIRQDRNLLREENTKLHQENMVLRDKVNTLEKLVFELKSDVARQGRRIDYLSGRARKTTTKKSEKETDVKD